ncbi:MAG: hypothetical protein WCG97_03780 [bacterium]
MLYLLTPEQKRKVLREYRMRLGVVFLIAMSCVGVIGIVSLIPSQTLVIMRQNLLAIKERGIEGGGASHVDELSKKIAEISSTASFLTPISQPVYGSDIFTHLESEAGDSTKIRQFQITHFDKDVSVSISGVSQNRDTLIKFINTLKQDILFSGATFPYGSLAKQDNLGFSLNMVVNLDKLSTLSKPTN